MCPWMWASAVKPKSGWQQNDKFDFQTSRIPNFRVSNFPDFRISKFAVYSFTKRHFAANFKDGVHNVKDGGHNFTSGTEAYI